MEPGIDAPPLAPPRPARPVSDEAMFIARVGKARKVNSASSVIPRRADKVTQSATPAACSTEAKRPDRLSRDSKP